MRQIRWPIWVAGLLGWFLISLVIAMQIDMGGLYGGTDVMVGNAFVWVMVSNLFWPAVLPLVVLLAKRWPPRVGNLRFTLPLHLLVGTGLGLLHALVAVVLAYPTGPFPELASSGFLGAVGSYLTTGMHVELVVYFALLGAAMAWHGHLEIQERTRRSAELEVQLSRSMRIPTEVNHPFRSM